MKKIIALALVILTLSVALISCNLGAKDKTFSKAGMSITLTKDFVEKDILSQTAYYESKDVIVTVLKEDFTLFNQAGISTDISVKEYGQLCIAGNMLTDTEELIDTDDMYGFSYEKQVSGKDFKYFAYCLRSEDGYWLIQCACETKNADKMASTFEKYVKSVKFD